MKKAFVFFALFFGGSAVASAQTKCEASLNGYRIRTVYITGNQFNAVVWAYKHLSDETCMTPTTDPAAADAILETVDRHQSDTQQASKTGALTVTCSSSAGSSSCIDSAGNELDVNCDHQGNCSSYYGPSPGVAVLNSIGEWLRNASYQAEVKLYTSDHKLIWKSETQKGWLLWYEKLREATGSPACPRSAFSTRRYKNYRQWASEQCRVVFDPLVAIDIKANSRIAARDQKQAEADEMKRNAEEAAAKQKANDRPVEKN
jgi:hypothetical protein